MIYFMSLVGYYRRFIKNFSQITYLITSLQRKGKKFEWIEECEASFEQLKQLLTQSLWYAKMLEREDLMGSLCKMDKWYVMSLGN